MAQVQKGSDHIARLLFKKLGIVESHFASLVESMDTVVRTDQKMADRMDALAKEFQMFGEEETPGIQIALTQISECYHKIQDHRRALITGINDNLITLLKDYEGFNKEMKNEVAEREKIKDKQLTKQKALERIQTREPTNQAKIKHAKVDRDVASGEAALADKQLVDNMIRFQQRKLDDVKALMRHLILMEMTFHARSIEILTEANEHIDTMCPERDIQDLIELRNTAIDLSAAAAAAAAPPTNLSASMRSTTALGVLAPASAATAPSTAATAALYPSTPAAGYGGGAAYPPAQPYGAAAGGMGGLGASQGYGAGGYGAVPQGTYTGSLLSQPPNVLQPQAGLNHSYLGSQSMMYPQTPMAADGRAFMTPSVRPTATALHDVSDLNLDDSRRY